MIPPIPEWLVATIRAMPDRPRLLRGANGTRPRSLSSDREAVYARQALRGIANALKATPSGGRNEALNKSAFRMGGMVARGWIDQTDVADELSEAAIASGLDVNEVQRTLASGLTVGMQQPADDLEDRLHPRTQHRGVCQHMGVEALGGADTEGQPRPSGRGKQTQADRLIEIATGESVELYHTPDDTAHADLLVNGHRETWPLKSAGFRGWLRREYYLATDGAPNAEAMSTALGVIEARARFDGVERSVYLRVAEHGNKVYLDLCNDDWSAVEIDANGWRIVDRPLVRFRRTPGMLPLPDPESGGSLDELRKHLHVDDSGYVLAVSWLLASLRPRGPYPILTLTGEQGTGKSFTVRNLRSLIDPHTASLRSLPRDTRDLYVVAMNGHVLVFDNLSSMSAEISDCLCRLSTGGGFSTRALYTDNDEVIFDGQRPIALTSITDVANRSDLADRLVIVRLDVIPDKERRPEEELITAFEAARPRILGALLDAVSHGLMQLPHTRLNRLPRMADYAVWVRACETAIWQAGMHMAAYEENRADAVDIVLDADPVAMALRKHMAGRSEDTTTATELLAALEPIVSDHVRRGRQWPGSARGLSGQLTRLGPALRRNGLTLEHVREAGTGGGASSASRGRTDHEHAPQVEVRNRRNRRNRRKSTFSNGLPATQAAGLPSHGASPLRMHGTLRRKPRRKGDAAGQPQPTENARQWRLRRSRRKNPYSLGGNVMNGNIECAFIGRVGTEPELKTSQSGKPWVAFNVAVGTGDDTQWVRIAAFGETAERLTGHITKGDKVYVEGTIKLNTWTDREGQQRTGLSVAAWKVEKLGQIGRNRPPKPKAPPEGQHPAPPSARGERRPMPETHDWQRPVDDAIPF